ncbi:MAG: YraN family protein [Zymomonas mobilis]|uniref:Putative endonuclease n=1 Tax=Zymomonas mobilis TaxID=542 RepID=A0A542W3B8_ZYMMB|nr:YraN family protein [Zymomonas mobilis]TQL18055.1 putative endonuclease [Zymomonas mobilis]
MNKSRYLKRKKAEKLGRLGEVIAVWWLRLHGWHIVEHGRRVKTRLGEVDIIARRGKCLNFIEVKTRRSKEELDRAIDYARLKRVAAAARYLAPRFMQPEDDVTIDVILWQPWHWPRHLRNVWHEN